MLLLVVSSPWVPASRILLTAGRIVKKKKKQRTREMTKQHINTWREEEEEEERVEELSCQRRLGCESRT